MFLLIDFLRKPTLDIICKDEPVSVHPTRWVHVFVVNKAARWIIKHTAVECRGRVTYTKLSLVKGEISKGPFETKWARKNPVQMQLDSEDKPVPVVDDRLIEEAKVEEIPPGVERALDIAVKFDGVKEAYVWTPESYYSRKNLDYVLDEGTWRVKVRIEYAGRTSGEKEFILENFGDRASGLTLRKA
jgi:hypothetical protein